MFRTSLAPKVFRGLRDGHLFFASIPSTSYWATFVGPCETDFLQPPTFAILIATSYVDARGRALERIPVRFSPTNKMPWSDANFRDINKNLSRYAETWIWRYYYHSRCRLRGI
jgi:hypothetical protein